MCAAFQNRPTRFVDQFSRTLHTEYADKGIHVQLQARAGAASVSLHRVTPVCSHSRVLGARHDSVPFST